MPRKFHPIFAAIAISAFIAITYALFPENGAYYGILAQGLEQTDKAPGIIASLYGGIWKIGGNGMVRFAVALSAFMISLLCMGCLQFAAARLASRTKNSKIAWLIKAGGWVIILLLAVIVMKDGLGNWRNSGTDRRLLAPLDLLDYGVAQNPKSVFINPYLRRFVLVRHPQWLSQNREPSWKAAVGNPSVWRKLDRDSRFDLILLSGPVAEFRPLLEHLQTSPDWQLVYMDNGGYAFARKSAGQPAGMVSPESLISRYNSPRNQARVLAQTAMQYAALKDYDNANKLLNQSESFDKNCPETYSARAFVDLQRKNWGAAIRDANTALDLDPSFLSALQIKVQALMENNQRQQAYFVSRDMLLRYPDDFYSLLLHAQIANTVHAYQSESDTLEKAVRLAEKNQFPSGAYRVFLAQSYAKQGMAPQAIEQFQIALKDQTLSEAQKSQIKESMATVRQRSGIPE